MNVDEYQPLFVDEDPTQKTLAYIASKSTSDGIAFSSLIPEVKILMGLKRLKKARQDVLLKTGYEQGLFVFSSDEDPIIRSVLISEPDPVVVEEIIEPEVIEEKKPEPKAIPENWHPPTYMDCGHLSFWMGPLSKFDFDEKGKLRDIPTGEMGCKLCSNKTYGDPRYIKNAIIPVNMRRTKEKTKGIGWSGYCTDENGVYIGGIGNNCLHEKYRSKDNNYPLCEGHQ